MSGRLLRAAVTAGSLGAVAIAAHTAVNLRYLRRPGPDSPLTDEAVEVLIPARDEAATVETTVRSVLAQEGVPRLRVTVLDDGSTDGTSALLDVLASTDARLAVVHSADEAPPDGWLGKPWACARLADSAEGSVLVFVDADVTLEPHAVRAVVATMRSAGLAMVAPYPHQLAGTWLERLVQPLVTWSWVATVPLRWAETSTRPSLSAANGQLLAMDADAYRSIGGHGSVRADVIEDVALMRAAKVAGLRTATVDGSALASCRMYDGTAGVVDGYAKSLWSAFNGPLGTAAVTAGLTGVFVLPALAAVAAPDRRTRLIGAVGYGAGTVSRALVARRTGERLVPDTFAHPASIAAFVALNAISWARHSRGANTWKGRPVITPPASA